MGTLVFTDVPFNTVDMTTPKKQTGNRGEDLAKAYLLKHEYEILVCNFHSRFGEIDIVARRAATIVFVEVKNYKTGSLRSPYEAITKTKQQKLIKTARYYLLCQPSSEMTAQFDVLLFESGQLLDHLQGAFFVT